MWLLIARAKPNWTQNDRIIYSCTLKAMNYYMNLFFSWEYFIFAAMVCCYLILWIGSWVYTNNGIKFHTWTTIIHRYTHVTSRVLRSTAVYLERDKFLSGIVYSTSHEDVRIIGKNSSKNWCKGTSFALYFKINYIWYFACFILKRALRN
jgi:hypothetical protein